MGKKAKYGYTWITLMFFALSLAGQWVFSWYAYVDEQQDHDEEIVVRDYVNLTLKDMFENWQSEFLQLAWQVAGLAILLHVGSPQSKEGDERLEGKVDKLLEESLGEEKAKQVMRELERKHPRA